MFLKILSAEIIGVIIGLIIGVIGLLLGGERVFSNKYFLGIVFTVVIAIGLAVFKMII